MPQFQTNRVRCRLCHNHYFVSGTAGDTEKKCPFCKSLHDQQEDRRVV